MAATSPVEAVEQLAVLIDTQTEPGPNGGVWADASDWVRWGMDLLGLPADPTLVDELGTFVFEIDEGLEATEIARLIIDEVLFAISHRNATEG